MGMTARLNSSANIFKQIIIKSYQQQLWVCSRKLENTREISESLNKQAKDINKNQEPVNNLDVKILVIKINFKWEATTVEWVRRRRREKRG